MNQVARVSTYAWVVGVQHWERPAGMGKKKQVVLSKIKLKSRLKVETAAGSRNKSAAPPEKGLLWKWKNNSGQVTLWWKVGWSRKPKKRPETNVYTQNKWTERINEFSQGSEKRQTPFKNDAKSGKGSHNVRNSKPTALGNHEKKREATTKYAPRS